MRRALILVLGSVLALLIGAFLLVQVRTVSCAPIPLLIPNILPNAQLARSTTTAPLPDGWSAAAPGAQLRGPQIDGQGFDYDGDGRALQLIGIANALESPAIPVHAGQAYCLAARALTDSEKRSPTRLQVSFEWHDQHDLVIKRDQSSWQSVALWQPDVPLRDWSALSASFTAPTKATTLRVQIAPASDDRVYLDALRVQVGGQPQARPAPIPAADVTLAAWPHGTRAALSFSFDWETAMGGLIHSRSVDDPYGDQDPIVRALRMRTGVTTTLVLFRPYGIRATYFANGYNFLLGNRERRTFMGDPTFTWAKTEQPYAWRTDAWTRTAWFAKDPYGTVASDPGWYFGDLVPILLAEQQAIETHTFSHLYAGFAPPQQLHDDLVAWNSIAAERAVGPARALAFPWSGSAGMADTSWQILERAGIQVITRTNRSQRQYQIVHTEDLHCQPVPGHGQILACPDFYLTPRSAPQAIGLIDRALTQEGMIDLWAHTEEVTSNEQLAAWGQVVTYAGKQQAAGTLWIAPLTEIASWQQARAQVQIVEQPGGPAGAARHLTLTNPSTTDLRGLTLRAPFVITRALFNGQAAGATISGPHVIIDLPAGHTATLDLWQSP